jgi:hypothetical protein
MGIRIRHNRKRNRQGWWIVCWRIDLWWMIKGVLKKYHIPIGENFLSCNIVKFVSFLSHRVTKKNAFYGTGRKF